MNLEPARLEPLRVPRIWGVRNLQPFYPEVPSGSPLVGEAWLTGDACTFASGPYAGQTLGHAWPEMPAEWTGTRLAHEPRIPLLAKLIFTADKLSVQVHPDDAYAQKHERAAGGVGKTEMWYVGEAAIGSKVCVGMRANVTRETFLRAIADGSAERCLAPIDVHAGDAIFVPAGTAHMIGPGVVLYEMQEYSDLTYRVFDFNRVGADGKPRELHIEKAMDVLRWDSTDSSDSPSFAAGRVVPIALKTNAGAERLLLVACRYFAVERWKFTGTITMETSPERFEVLTPLAGNGRIALPRNVAPSESRALRAALPPNSPSPAPSAEFDYAPGQTWLVPAALGKYEIESAQPTTLLRAYVPNLEALERELAAARAAQPSRASEVRP